MQSTLPQQERDRTVTPSNIKSFFRTLLCAAALLAFTPAANAQLGADLPSSTTEAISISTSQKSQINSFVQTWTQRALSENPQDNKKAIDALTKPLKSRSVSVAFRQSYTQSINPLLKELDNKDTIAATLASLRIAADLATPSATTKIKAALNNNDLGIQLFAASRAGQIFKTTKSQGPAITQSDADSLINALQTLASETNINPELYSASIRALIAATTLSSKDMGDARSNAIDALAQSVGAQLRALDPNDDPAPLQAIALNAASAITASIADISSNTTPQAVKAAVGLGADIISVPLRRVLAGTLEPTSQRDLTIKSVQAGETLLYFALKKETETTRRFSAAVKQTNFAQLLEAGDDKAFRNQASLLLAPGSPIVKAFDFDDDRFLH
jgi:hypothetical protein